MVYPNIIISILFSNGMLIFLWILATQIKQLLFSPTAGCGHMVNSWLMR